MAIILVSRQLGSQGDQIGALVAERLGYRFIERNTIHEKALHCDEDFASACNFYETSYDQAEQVSFFDRMVYGNPAYTALFESLHCEVTAENNVVVLGRGPQVALRDVPGILKVRVVGPRRERARRVAAGRGISDEEALDCIDRFDKQRKTLVESVYHIKLDLDLYDLVLNTGAFAVEAAVDLICAGADKIMRPLDNGALSAQLNQRALAKRVESKIKRKIITSPYRNVAVTAAAGGVVTLAGQVQDAKSREKAEAIARSEEGVTEVANQIKTTELTF